MKKDIADLLRKAHDLQGEALETQRKILRRGLAMLVDLVPSLPSESRGALLEHLTITLAALEKNYLPTAASSYLAFIRVLKELAPHAQKRAVLDVAETVARGMVKYGESYLLQLDEGGSDG